jgi:hypothetical protein
MAITVKHTKVSSIPDGVDTSVVRPSDWNADHSLSGVIDVANGGTGVSSSSGANSVVLRDANGNITTNCLFEGFTSQAANVTTIVLTAASVQNFQITGSGGQTIKLPNATTLPNGALFTFNNNQSSGSIIVQNNSSTTVATINSGGYVTVVLLDNSIAAGTWDRHDSTPSNVSWSTNTLDYAGSITSATWNGNAVAVNRGGTGQSSYTDGQLLIGNSTGNTLTKATLSAGTGISVTNAGGSITIANTSPSSGGTVTSVTGTAPVVSSGGTTPDISLAASYGDTQNPYASKTLKYFLAAPNAADGVPTFRAMLASDVPTLNQNTTGSAATLTTPRNIYGNSFDGSAALTQIIASTYGGTGNGFTKFSGATTAEKTYTLPDANATILYSGGALGTPSGGTVTNLTGTASININGTVGATTASTVIATQLTVNGSNLNTAISPTGTGTVTISPAGALTINPTAVSTINNASIGATTASTGRFTSITATTGTITPATGTASVAPISLTSGVNLTSAVAGAIEYDGNNLYFTPDTSQLRTVVADYQQFYLSANVTAFGSASGNFFGATSAASLAATSTYDIDCYCYFLKTTAGTGQWIPTFSSAVTVGHSYLEYTPVTGFTTSVITGAMVVSEATQQTTTVLTHTATASLTTAVYHIAKLRIRVLTNTACNFRLNFVGSAGTITPQAGSYYTVRKVVTSSGNFVA